MKGPLAALPVVAALVLAPLLATGCGASPEPDAPEGGTCALVVRAQRGEGSAGADVEIRRASGEIAGAPFFAVREAPFRDVLLGAGLVLEEPRWTGRAEPDRPFLVTGLVPGTYEVRGIGPGGGGGVAQATLPAEGARVECVLELAEGDETLLGRAVYADSRPFRDWIVVQPRGGGRGLRAFGPGVRVLRPDAEGRFVAGGLPPHDALVTALVPGRLRAVSPPVTLPREEEYLFVVDAAQREVRGRVATDGEGAPVAGASLVVAAGDLDSAFLAVGLTADEDGRFAHPVPAGRGAVFAEAPGYSPGYAPYPDEGTAEIEVRMARAGRVTGRVVRAQDGRAQPGCRVVAIADAVRGAPQVLGSGESGPDGTYAMDILRPGRCLVFAMGGGWCSTGLGEVPAEGRHPLVVDVVAGEEREVVLEVEPAAVLEGRLTTPAGAPVAGAVLRVETLIALRQGSPHPVRLLAGVASDPDGRWHLGTVAPRAEVRVTARVPGHAGAAAREALDLASGERARVDLTLTPTRTLEVRVEDALTGEPVPGAFVVAARHDAGAVWTPLARRATADERGVARVGPVPEEVIGLRARASGYVRVQAWEAVDASGDGPFVLRLDPERAIAGRVVAPPEVPVEGTRLLLRSAPSGEDPPRTASAAVAADGTFRVKGLHPATYDVEARLRWGDRVWLARASVPAGTEDLVLALELQPLLRVLEVVVRDGEGEAVPRGRIQVTALGTRVARVAAGSLEAGGRGTVEVPSDVAGDDLWLDVFELPDPQWGPHRRGPLTLEDFPLEVQLEPARRLAGRVTDGEGAGVEGTRVLARARPADPESRPDRVDAVGTTDAAGAFVLEGLGDLPYRLTLHPPEGFVTPRPVDVTPGPQEAVLVVRRAVAVTLAVRDEEGQPVRGARALLWRGREERPLGAGQTGEARSTAAGDLRVEGLDPEEAYRLEVLPPAHRPDLRPERRAGWQPRDETVVLRAGHPVRGVVRDPEGAPVPHALVHHRMQDAGTAWEQVEADEEGAFEILGLPQGLVELHAALADAPARSGGDPVTVPAGRQDVVLVLAPDLVLRVRVEGWPAETPYAFASLFEEGPDERPRASTTVRSDGLVRFAGLSADGVYALWIGGLAGGRYVLAEGLRPGPEERVVEPRQGLAIRGRLLLPAGVTPDRFGVSARWGRLSVHGGVDPSGGYVVDGLPPGRWTVRVWGEQDGVRYNVAVEVEAGEERDIEVRAP